MVIPGTSPWFSVFAGMTRYGCRRHVVPMQKSAECQTARDTIYYYVSYLLVLQFLILVIIIGLSVQANSLYFQEVLLNLLEIFAR